MKKDIVVLGDKKDVLLFKAVGCDTLSPKEERLKATFASLVDSYKIIYVFSYYARLIMDQIEETKDSIYPIVTILPEGEGDNMAMDMLSKQIKDALGSGAVLDGE